MNIHDLAITGGTCCNTVPVRQYPTATGLSCHVDYLVLTGVGCINTLLDLVWSLSGATFDIDNAVGGTRGVYYDKILRSPSGIEIAHESPVPGSSICKIRLSIGGKPLARIDPRSLYQFCLDVGNLGYSCTRFDWAVDDFQRTLSMDCIESAGIAENYSRSGAFGVTYRRKFGQEVTAKTLYFGCPSSAKYIRFYDKAVESKGKINAIRFEVQWRKGCANTMFEKFCSVDDNDSRNQLVSDYAVGSVDFVLRSNSVLSRCPRLDFWENFLSRAGSGLKLSVPRKDTNLDETMQWIEEKIAPSLAKVALCMGIDELFKWLESLIRYRLKQGGDAIYLFFANYRDTLATKFRSYEDGKVACSRANMQQKLPLYL